MTEDTVVREFAHVYKDAVKVEGSLEIRKIQASTSDWLRSPPKSVIERLALRQGIQSGAPFD